MKIVETTHSPLAEDQNDSIFWWAPNSPIHEINPGPNLDNPFLTPLRPTSPTLHSSEESGLATIINNNNNKEIEVNCLYSVSLYSLINFFLVKLI